MILTPSRPEYRIRRARLDDLPQLADVYRSTVRAMGPSAYTPAQVESWAGYADDVGFADFVLTAVTFVAVVDDRPVGFCGIHSNGHVASLYVAAEHSRRGIGSALLSTILDYAATTGIRQLDTDASAFSRPVFERHGFVVDRIERVVRQDVVFYRYRMLRAMEAP